MKKIFLFALLLLSTLVFNSCEKDPTPPTPMELITTVNYTLSPSSGGADVVLTFQDLDGDGGNDPIITGGTLEANQTYTGSLELLDESQTPAEDITEEIMEEDEEHQFFFQTDITGLIISYTDQDPVGNPIGLASSLSTANTGSGTLTVILRHEPDKGATGVSTGDITNAGGETDIEVDLPVEVQ